MGENILLINLEPDRKRVYQEVGRGFIEFLALYGNFQPYLNNISKIEIEFIYSSCENILFAE
jgi:hypothetical protein